MNILDILICIPLLYAIYKGFTKGFIHEAATLAALILGIYGAIHFSDFTSEFIQDTFNYESQYMGYISFIITFIAIVIGVNLVGNMIDKLVHAIALGFINRLLGIALSLIKVGIVLSIVVHLFNQANNKFNFISEEKKRESLLYEPMNELSNTLFNFFSSDLSSAKDKFKDATKAI